MDEIIVIEEICLNCKLWMCWIEAIDHGGGNCLLPKPRLRSFSHYDETCDYWASGWYRESDEVLV